MKRWPKPFAAHRAQLEALARPCVYVVPGRLGDPKPWESSLCGMPYAPTGTRLPRGMFCVAQLDFAEVPRLAGFPDRGLAQFWIDLEFERTRVLWIAKPSKDVGLLAREDYEGYDDGTAGNFPPRRVKLEAAAMLPTSLDPDGSKALASILGDDEDLLASWNDFAWPLGEHWIGGYAQSGETPRRNTAVALHLGGDGLIADEDLGWGDTGDATWFVDAARLQRGDFSRARWHWEG